MLKPSAVTWCVLLVLADGAASGQTAFLRMSGEKTPETVPIILDTDIGTDVDDAFALALALASPELELRGVTTVSGDAFTRAMIACRFLDAVGHPRVPVAAGLPPREVPMLDGQYQYGLRPARKRPASPSAVEFLFEALKADPGRITLITIGDLTNVARLIRDHPDSKAWIRRVVLMGGSIRVGYRGTAPIDREWNIRSDIEAAQTVFRSGIPLVVAPLDATVTLKLAEPHRRRIFATDIGSKGPIRCGCRSTAGSSRMRNRAPGRPPEVCPTQAREARGFGSPCVGCDRWAGIRAFASAISLREPTRSV